MPQIDPSCATTPLELMAIRKLNVRAEVEYIGDIDRAFQEFTQVDGFMRTYFVSPHHDGLLRLYREYRRDINKLLAEAQGIGGRPPSVMPEWRNDDPLALTKRNRRLLAEFGLREAMKRVYERHNGQTGVHQEAPNVGRETWQGRWTGNFGSVFADWNSRPELASIGWVSAPPSVPQPVLQTTGPTGSPVGEH